MASLNQISERIAYAKGDPLNIMLRENLKFSVKYWRSMLIRRDITTNGVSDEYLQRIVIPLIKVDILGECGINVSCKVVLRTTNKIPKPVRIKSDVLFKFVGVLDQTDNLQPATYVEGEELRYTKFNRFTPDVLRYSYINEYLYFFNNTLLKKAIVQSPFANPSQVNLACEGCYNDDMEFPCPDDMIQQIVQGILTGELNVREKPLSEEIILNTDT